MGLKFCLNLFFKLQNLLPFKDKEFLPRSLYIMILEKGASPGFLALQCPPNLYHGVNIIN